MQSFTSLFVFVFAFAFAALGCGGGSAALDDGGMLGDAGVADASMPPADGSTPPDGGGPEYLLFQIGDVTPSLMGASGHVTISKADIESQMEEIKNAIGQSGDGTTRQLGFMIGPVMFDLTDDQMTTWIENAFAAAEEEGVAVGFHIDDSMFWYNRNDLWSNNDNVEWSDWSGTPVPHRIIGWVAGGMPIMAPPICFNSPAIVAETTRIASEVIGPAIKQGIDHLASIGKPNLFGGVITGWETRMQDDSHDPHVPYGYCALTNLGYSESSPPDDFDLALEGVVSDWITLWDQGLSSAGVPTDQIYTHIAYPPPPTNPPPGVNILGMLYNDSDPNVTAFNDYSNPGFTMYGVGGFSSLHDILASHGTPPWGTSEGNNVALPDPTHPTEHVDGTMEQYLAAVFNHGGAYVDLFGWGDAGGTNTFAMAVAGTDAIAAYQKFLRGDALSE